MKDLKALLVAAIMSCAIGTYAEPPIMITEVPQRYIFRGCPFDVEDGYKFDTATGQLWELQSFYSHEKVKVTPFKGIEIDSDPYNGRFTFEALAANGHAWIYIFDSKTGNIWTTNIINRKKDYQFHSLIE